MKNNTQYYLELIPESEHRKYLQIWRSIDKLNKLGAKLTNDQINNSYKYKVKRFFVGKYKDGSDIPTPYIEKDELFNNQYNTRVTLFTKEQAEKHKDSLEKYAKNWIVNIKPL